MPGAVRVPPGFVATFVVLLGTARIHLPTALADSSIPTRGFSAITEGLARAEEQARAAQPLTAVAADRFRIQRHLAAVEAYLRAQPTERLPLAARRQRPRSLDALHAYWTAGVFPRNTAHPGQRRPYFIDNKDRACAVAHLLRVSGHEKLAEHVDQRQHNAYVADMDEPHLLEWAAEAGLTVADLALIQPGYCACGSFDTSAGEDSVQPYEPVCGSDGLTYWNECAAELCGGASIAHEGECDYGPVCDLCGIGRRMAVVSECNDEGDVEVTYGVCGMQGGDSVAPVNWAVAEKWLELQQAGCPKGANYEVDPDDLYSGSVTWSEVREQPWECESGEATGGEPTNGCSCSVLPRGMGSPSKWLTLIALGLLLGRRSRPLRRRLCS